MDAHFHIDLGPFTIDVRLDDSGVHLQRGPHSQTIAWAKISGATVLPVEQVNELREKEREQRALQFLGQDAVRTIEAMSGKVGQIAIAYRDEKNRLQQTEIPAPVTDKAFLGEFQTRLGSRWLGQSANHEQAAERLHTNPGFFKSVFVLAALFAIVAVVAILFLLGFMGPILNIVSIQKMLLDLQDGNYTSFMGRLATYVILFIITYFLHRVIRARLNSMKSAVSSRLGIKP